MELKFEEAFLKTENRIITLAELSQLFDKDLQSFSINVRSNLYCPKCHKAKLVYVNGDERHLRTHPKAQHIDCDLEQDIVPPKKVKSFVKDEKNSNSIKHQKELLLMMMLGAPHQIEPNTESEPKVDTDNQKANPKQTQKVSRPLRLSQKRIDLKLRDEDFDVYKFFYGEVLIQWEGLNDDRKRLLLRDKASGRFLCRIYVSSLVFHYISPNWITESQRAGFIVVLGELKKNENARWPYLILENSEFLSVAFQ